MEEVNSVSVCEQVGYQKTINKLKALVKDAHDEGYYNGAKHEGVEWSWKHSDAFKMMED